MRQDLNPAHETTPQCNVRETSAEIETIYRSYQVLLLILVVERRLELELDIEL